MFCHFPLPWFLLIIAFIWFALISEIFWDMARHQNSLPCLASGPHPLDVSPPSRCGRSAPKCRLLRNWNQNSQSQACLSLKNDPLFWWEHSWEFLWTNIDDAWFLHRARILPSFGNIDMEIFSQETVCCDGILNIPAILRDMWDAIVGVSSER